MSQNLSFNSIAATLAVHSASGLVACASAPPPAQSPADAKEVPAATTAGATAATEAAPLKDEAKPAEGASAASAASATPAPEAPKPADAAAATPAAKEEKPKAMGKKKAGAKAGCGAGTCG
jgi:hypothetical protein